MHSLKRTIKQYEWNMWKEKKYKKKEITSKSKNSSSTIDNFILFHSHVSSGNFLTQQQQQFFELWVREKDRELEREQKRREEKRENGIGDKIFSIYVLDSIHFQRWKYLCILYAATSMFDVCSFQSAIKWFS